MTAHWYHRLPFWPKSKPEVVHLTRESPHYLTVQELIDRLLLIEDRTSVLVDMNDYPVSALFSGAGDKDFGCTFRLGSYASSRGLYQSHRAARLANQLAEDAAALALPQ